MKNKLIKIFIVEDNKVFAMTLKADIENYFAKRPIDIQLFETGEESWEKFRDEKPQVVILDYNLNTNNPNAMDGNEVLSWYKRENPKTKVILMTSEDSTDIAIESFKIGAFDYVVKTETQFKKIHLSLLNLFNLIKVENESKIYRNIIIAIVLAVSLLLGGVAAIQVFAPTLLRN